MREQLIPFALATLAFALVAFAVLLFVLWRWQERVVFQPPAGPWPTAGGAERVTFTASDGQPLFAYVVGDPVDSRGALIAFHGNADLAVWMIPWAQEVARRTGARVVMPEYRGYAGLGGAPTYEGSRLDALAAYGMVRDSLGVPPAAIALFGHSLGSAIATELATEVARATRDASPRALVLQSPLTSARDMARVIVFRPAMVAWGTISRVHFDTETRVRTLRVPTSVAHGTRDLVIPVRMGKRVFEAAATKGGLLIVPRAGHNDVPEVAGEEYWTWLGRALGA